MVIKYKVQSIKFKVEIIEIAWLARAVFGAKIDKNLADNNSSINH